jgi:hypothetical protein
MKTASSDEELAFKQKVPRRPLEKSAGFSIGKPSENGDLTKKNGDLIWLVVWNMNFIFPHIGKFIIPTDELTPSFFRGVGLNHQPDSPSKNFPQSFLAQPWDYDHNPISVHNIP